MKGPQPTRRIVVYDGSRLLGEVREAAARTAWQAFDAHENSLGVFDSSVDAARAVTAEFDRASAERLRKSRS